MSRKVVVKKIDEEKREIILEKKDKAFIIFFRRHWFTLFLTALILSLTVFIIAIVYTISSIESPQNVSSVPIEVSFGDELETSLSDLGPVSEDYVDSLFAKNENVIDSGYGVVLINDRVSTEEYEIVFYSDGSAKKVYKTGLITRISALANGEYGVDTDGNISMSANSVSITILKTVQYSYGVVSYYSDGSAEILLNDGNVAMFIRSADDLYDNFILDSGVSSFISSSDGVIKYSDGSAVKIINDEYYAVSNIDDDNIDNYFKEVSRVSLDDGRSIIYFANGSATIIEGDTYINVRKSNAINITNNKLYDITNSYYASVCDTKNLSDGSVITYYNNGSATITGSDGSVQLVIDSNDIILDGNKITKIDGDKFDSLAVIDGEDGTTINFGDYVMVKLDSGEIIIASSDEIVIDSTGNFKELVSDDEVDGLISFKIANNNGQDVKYAVVLEASDKSDLDSKYVNYRISSGVNNVSGLLANNVWDNSELAGGLEVDNEGYLLLEGTLTEYQVQNINLLLYVLEDGTVQNYLMDKYFYGTLKVYAWVDE